MKTKFLFIMVGVLIIFLIGAIIFLPSTKHNNGIKENAMSSILPSNVLLEDKKITTNSFINNNQYKDSFKVEYQDGLIIYANDSQGQYYVRIKGFIEDNTGRRTNINLQNNNIPFYQVDDKTYEYNITFSSISMLSSNINNIGLYFETSKGVETKVNNYNNELNYTEEISFCRDDNCIDLWFKKEKMEDTYTSQKIIYNLSDKEIKINVNGLTSLNIDPTIRFGAGDTIESMDLTPLTNNTFAITWCDETTDDIHLQMFNTTGENYTNVIDIDTSIGTCANSNTQVNVAGLNETSLVISYADFTDKDMTFAVYDVNGNQLVAPTDVDDNVNAAFSNSISVLSDTKFVLGYLDDTDDDASFVVYYSNGTLLTSSTDVDTSIGEHISGVQTISVSAFNSTTFVISWSDSSSSKIYFAIYDINGNQLVAPIESNAGGQFSKTSVSTLTPTTFVLGYYDDTAKDITFETYYSNGTIIAGSVDVDTDVTANGYPSTSRINDTVFVISYFDDTDDDHTFAVYDVNGNQLVAPTDSEISASTGIYYNSIVSSPFVSNIGFCNGNFIHAFSKNTTYASWISYYPNGTAWNGTCIYGGGEEPPADSCSCPSSNTNWIIAMTDYCNITSACNIGTGNLSFTGAGYCNVSNTITANKLSNINLTNGATIYLYKTGGIINIIN